MGGGLAFCDGTVQSNLVIWNRADNQAGGMARCRGSILNNTFCGNSAGLDGGGLYSCTGVISNCIFWENGAVGLGPQIYESSTPSFSCIQDWTAGGTGNTDSDPDFAEPTEDNYRLLAGSPCIDAGDGSILARRGLDMDGKLRIAFGERSLVVDMGAYEYNSSPFVLSDVLLEEAGSTLRLIWNSQPDDAYTLWSCTSLRTGEWVKEGKGGIVSRGVSTFWTFPTPAGQLKFYRVEMK